MKAEKFEKGDTIAYEYTHWLNKKSSTQIIKYGIFIRKIKSKTGWSPNPKIAIMINGNKSESIVFMSQITLISRGEFK